MAYQAIDELTCRQTTHLMKRRSSSLRRCVVDEVRSCSHSAGVRLWPRRWSNRFSLWQVEYRRMRTDGAAMDMSYNDRRWDATSS
jgi:hypothetical protein